MRASAPARPPQPSSSAASAPVTADRSPKPPKASGRLAGSNPSSQPERVVDTGSAPASSAARR